MGLGPLCLIPLALALAAPGAAFADPVEADVVLAEFEATGETRSCVRLSRIDQIEPLDATRWLIEMRNGQHYLNTVTNGCQRAPSRFTYLEYRTPTASLCRGEIVRVRNQTGGYLQGACSLGVFERLDPIGDAPSG